MSGFHDALGRIGSFAVIDIVGTLIGMEILYHYTFLNSFGRLFTYLLGFAAGIVAHYVAGVNTPLNELLGITVPNVPEALNM